MDVLLSELFKLNVFSSGRRMFALRQMRAQAQSMRFRSLVSHIDQSLAYEQEVRNYERQWRARDSDTAGTETRSVDALIDRVLTAIRDTALAQTGGARPGDAIIERVERFVDTIFPMGVQVVTSLPYVDELAAAEDIKNKLQGELADDVAELGLERLVDRLAELIPEYRNALEHRPKPLRFETVREARARGQANMLGAVALAIGKYYNDDDPEHVDARSRLLAPILEQHEAVRSYLRMRRSVRDIDPDTGELDTSEPDTDEPDDELTATTAAAVESATADPAPHPATIPSA